MGTAHAKAQAQQVQRATDLFEKCGRFTAAREAMERGVYPYFQPIEQSFDTEVIIRGERKIMVGSNNYLGLTHHPYVLERAEAALHRWIEPLGWIATVLLLAAIGYLVWHAFG